MINYDASRFGLMFILQCNGSVFPKAVIWAIPNAVLAFLLHVYARQEQVDGNQMSMNGVMTIWTGYTSVLGFLIVFRNNQAYTRFWEGATLISQIRGEWFNAISTLFAFCSQAKEMKEEVTKFQHILIRLASMLYCSALQQVCDLDDDCLEIIENRGFDLDSLDFMESSNDRCEVILQWLQRLIVESEQQHVITVAPPLITRAFQEFSRGIVNLNNARKIKEIPFPFPYAQMITCMGVVHWMSTPMLASQLIESCVAAVVTCFLVTFAFWCLIYIALEIDQPFGEDPNDLPLREMQRDFNVSLLTLMHPLAQRVPPYSLAEVVNHTMTDDTNLPSWSQGVGPLKNDCTMDAVTLHHDSSSHPNTFKKGENHSHKTEASSQGVLSKLSDRSMRTPVPPNNPRHRSFVDFIQRQTMPFRSFVRGSVATSSRSGDAGRGRCHASRQRRLTRELTSEVGALPLAETATVAALANSKVARSRSRLTCPRADSGGSLAPKVCGQASSRSGSPTGACADSESAFVEPSSGVSRSMLPIERTRDLQRIIEF